MQGDDAACQGAVIAFVKDPSAVLDYRFNWADWLASTETITARTVTVPAGLTKDSDSVTDSATSVTVWLSGGTVDTDYRVACRVTTNQGRTDERTMLVEVRER